MARSARNNGAAFYVRDAFPTLSAYNDYFSLGTSGVLDRLNQLQADDPGSPVFDPRFNQATIFQSPRLARIGFGVEF